MQSACGGASAAVGPFYCPADQQVYIDLSFFEQMEARLGGGGDFAQAYVIAHEVGHHVQTVTGVSEKVNAVRMRGGSVEGADGLLVRQELQADCYAGMWANRAQQRHSWLEPGDLEEALRTATAIGDDTLQREGQGRVTNRVTKCEPRRCHTRGCRRIPSRCGTSGRAARRCRG